MKSFAARARDALTRQDALLFASRDARLAELAGLVLTCGRISLAGGGTVWLAMRTEHAGTARWIVRLLRCTFPLSPAVRIIHADRLGGRTTYEVRLEEAGSGVMAALGISPLAHSVPRHCLKSRKSRDAFLRGVFLGCGTVTDPEKWYQMEFSVASEKMGRSLARLLQMFYHLHAGVAQRREGYVVYIKEGDGIIAVLSAIGAHGAILEYENVRITKEARNLANRAANCDSGNITKMLDAAQRQLEAIAVIERTIGLDALPGALREIALERKQHADLALEDLGAMLEPPVGKSGVHHRLRRIEAMAKAITDKEEGGATT